MATIAVAGAAGRVGRAVAEQLLDEGASVALLVRDAAKVADLAARGAVVHEGDLQDPPYVMEATDDAGQLFWMTPTDPAHEDLLAFMDDLGVNASAAVARNSIERVVNLSSFGAHIPTAAGPVEGLHDNEERLDEFEENIVHLRPGFFMDNYLGQLDSIRAGRVRFPLVDGSVSLPMVATRDIARAAAQLLHHPEWSGHHILGLHGPRDLTFDEAAEILGVVHEPVPAKEAREELLAGGASEDGARLVLSFFAALAEGSLASGEERTGRTTTPTSFEQFAEETLRPLLDP